MPRQAAIIPCAMATAGGAAGHGAQPATGVPIATHPWAAGRAEAVPQAIVAQEGVELRRVIIGHRGDTDDLTYLALI
jgi:predicted metal-dependent phosphotriesterase family hydrolase